MIDHQKLLNAFETLEVFTDDVLSWATWYLEAVTEVKNWAFEAVTDYLEVLDGKAGDE